MKFSNSIITNQLFYKVYEGEESLYSELNDYKLLLVLDYLHGSVNRKGMCAFTLEDMITSCGFIINKNKGKSVDQFKSILVYLQDKGYIIYNRSFADIKPKEFITCEPNLRDDNKFVTLPTYVREKIMNYSGDKVNNVQLLFYWCYLHSRVNRRKDTKSDEDVDTKMYGGRACTCYVSYKKIKEDIGLTDVTIDKYNKILVELNLLRYDSNGMITKDGITKESCNVYYTISKEMTSEEIDKADSLVNINIDLGLKQQLEDYKSEGWVKTDAIKNDRSIAGKIGALTRLKNENRATQEQLNELEKMKLAKEEQRENNVEGYYKEVMKSLENKFNEVNEKLEKFSDSLDEEVWLEEYFDSFVEEFGVNKKDKDSINKAFSHLLKIEKLIDKSK